MIDIGNKFAVAMLSMTTQTNLSLVSMTFKMAVTPFTPYKSCDTVPVNKLCKFVGIAILNYVQGH